MSKRGLRMAEPLLRTVEEIMARVNETLTDRGPTYGDMYDQAKRFAALLNAYIFNRQDPFAPLSAADAVAVCQLLKTSRMTGGQYRQDNFVDNVGFGVILAVVAAREETERLARSE